MSGSARRLARAVVPAPARRAIRHAIDDRRPPSVPVGTTLYSEANDRRFEHWIWQPPNAPGPLPLLVLLHGTYDAGGSCWWQTGSAHQTLHHLVTSGAVPPVAVVMATDTGVSQGSAYCDWADGSTKAETHIIDELLPWLETRLPMTGERFISGLSMGGYGAWMLALRHPGLFRSATATSASMDPRRLFDSIPDVGDRIWGGEAGERAHDPRALIEEPDRRAGLRLAFDCGVNDYTLTDNRALHQRLVDLGVAHGYAEHSGGHDWTYWSGHLADHVRFHFRAGGPLTD